MAPLMWRPKSKPNDQEVRKAERPDKVDLRLLIVTMAPNVGLRRSNAPEAPNGGLRLLNVTMAPNMGLELEVLVAKADLKKED